MDFRSRPKGEFLRIALWQELYDLTKHWKNEMDFYRDEISFLFILLNENMTDLTHDMTLAGLKKIYARLSDLDEIHKTIGINIKMQIHELKCLMEKDECQDEQQFRDEHALLEDQFINFNRLFKQLKRDVFYHVERILRSNKKDHLLSNG